MVSQVHESPTRGPCTRLLPLNLVGVERLGVYENKGPPKIDPQIAGFPEKKDPNRVPLISSTPIYPDKNTAATRQCPKMASASRGLDCLRQTPTLSSVYLNLNHSRIGFRV